MVERHEPERRIDGRVGDGDIETVPIGDRLPVMDGRAAQRVDAELEAGRANRLHVDDVRQIGDIGLDEVDLEGRAGPDGLGKRHALDRGGAGSKQAVGAVLDPGGDVRIGRAAVGRVVLEAAVGGRVVRRGDHDAVASVWSVRPRVVDQDRVRDHRSRRHSVVALKDRLDALGRQHLERRPLGRARECVRVLAHEQAARRSRWLAGSRRWPG